MLSECQTRITTVSKLSTEHRIFKSWKMDITFSHSCLKLFLMIRKVKLVFFFLFQLEFGEAHLIVTDKLESFLVIYQLN